jgi:hypothetical protein
VVPILHGQVVIVADTLQRGEIRDVTRRGRSSRVILTVKPGAVLLDLGQKIVEARIGLPHPGERGLRVGAEPLRRRFDFYSGLETPSPEAVLP